MSVIPVSDYLEVNTTQTGIFTLCRNKDWKCSTHSNVIFTHLLIVWILRYTTHQRDTIKNLKHSLYEKSH